MSNLSVLEQRVLYRLPTEFHEPVMEEFNKFIIESSRMSEDENKIGQATLTDSEINRLNTTNQHGNNGLTVIEYQSIKAKAIENGIMDWTSKVDSTLSYHENLSLMEKNNGNY